VGTPGGGANHEVGGPKRADITVAVSPHWMRRGAHASHSLDRGAAIHLVKTTLGHSSIAITGMSDPRKALGAIWAV